MVVSLGHRQRDLMAWISLFKLFGEVLYRFSDIENNFGDDVEVSGITNPHISNQAASGQ